VGPFPGRRIEAQAVLKTAVPVADAAAHFVPSLDRKEIPLLVLSISLVLLLAVLVWFLVRFAALRGWHAVLCILFGFYLASTPLAPYIQTGCRAVAQFVAGVGL
jgi:hypothetical protein